MTFHTKEYETIKKFYGERKAKRSNVPLINHIDEGIKIMEEVRASKNAKKAFCIHPIVQNDENVDVFWSISLETAFKYRRKANAYLCRPGTDWVKTINDVYLLVGDLDQDVWMMLWADKNQNKKDFLKHHWGTHPRGDQLLDYFNYWIAFLSDQAKKHDHYELSV